MMDADKGNDRHDDLIVDEGFAVLNNFQPKKAIDGADNNSNAKIVDPIPRYSFASFANALSMPLNDQRESFLKDCSLVFTARTKEDSESYSTGETFFLPCLMKPRCALEALVRSHFLSITRLCYYWHFGGCDDSDLLFLYIICHARCVGNEF